MTATSFVPPTTMPFFKLPAIFDSKVNEQRPSPLLLLLEGRAVFEWLGAEITMPILSRSLPKGDGHPVLVLPGFMAGDLSTSVLRRFLTKQGGNPPSN
jgi:hypothetical protein